MIAHRTEAPRTCTVGDLRKALAGYPPNARLTFRGETIIRIETQAPLDHFPDGPPFILALDLRIETAPPTTTPSITTDGALVL